MDDLAELRWCAVAQRDAAHRSLFVYAVRTTGIYCRPGCASRRPLRENVTFFSSAEDAVASGFRACRRCRPDDVDANEPSVAAVIAVCRQIARARGALDIRAVAASLGWSERHLRRRFVETVGVPIGSYERACRAERARELLHAGSVVTDTILGAGYGSSRAFYDHGAPRLGMSPRTYRSGAPGEVITYTVVSTVLGTVLAACTERGLCAVRLGEDEATCEAEIRAEFAKADLVRDDGAMQNVAAVIAGAVGGVGDATKLPVDLAGTAFQVRVWEALRAIPSGETRTYGEVAAAVGSPRAVRAVGSACGANPVVVAVPCHRVVRADGSLGGFRWGTPVKAALLAAEAASGAGAVSGAEAASEQ